MGFLCGQGLLGCLTSVSYLLSRHYIVLHAIGIAANRGLRWIVSTTTMTIENQTHYGFEFTLIRVFSMVHNHVSDCCARVVAVTV